MKAWKWVLLALIMVLAWYLRGALGILLALLLLASTIAYIASPLARFFEDRLSKKWGAALAFFILLGVFAGWLMTFVPLMIRQAVAVGEALPGLWEKAGEILEQWQDKLLAIGLPEDLMQSIGEQAAAVLATVLEGLRKGAMNAVQWLGSIGWVALSPVVAYYLLRDRQEIFSFIERLVPSRARSLVLSVAAGSREAIGQYVRGQVVISLITGVLTAIGLLIAGLPSWLLMGFFMAIFNLIPYFGPVLGAIPIVLLAAAQGWGMILKCLIVVVATQQIESMLVTPRILSNASDLHPVVVVVALFIGGSMGGLAGMVFAIPCVLILRVVF